MPPAKITSLREYAIYYAVVIFVAVCLAASIHYFFYNSFINKLRHHEHVQQLEYSADSVTRVIGFYQDVVDTMSRQTEVIDLLQFGNDAEVQLWSRNMQRMLPRSIGLALFNASGVVRGDRSSLRLSDHCFADLRRRLSGQTVPQPPVHYKIERLAHFDIVSPVMQDGQKIGLVFASFSIKIVGNLLDNMSRENHAFQIVTPEKYVLESVEWLNDSGVRHYEMTIPGTDWLIRSQVIDADKNIFLASLLISNILAFVLVSVVLVFAINKLFRLVVNDFEIIRWMMHRIKDGSFDPGDSPRPNLHESAGIVRFIQHMGEELSLHQKKLQHDSSTDELTGLFNRRMLNERLDTCLRRVDEDGHIYVVILDLDYFKKVNDVHGHDLGDSVLKEMAEALCESITYEDLCARAGGDEFIVILDGYEKADVEAWYQRLSRRFAVAMDELARSHAIEFRIGVSAGCTAMRPDDSKSAVLKRADEALYNVKAQGRNHIMCAQESWGRSE